MLLLFGFVYTLAPNVADALALGDPRLGARRRCSGCSSRGSSRSTSRSPGNYSKTYGSLATGVILMLWLNYTAWAILFGAELNSELERRRS